MARLEQIEDTALFRPLSGLQAMGLEAEPLINYIAGNTYEHYREHLEAMRSITPPRGDPSKGRSVKSRYTEARSGFPSSTVLASVTQIRC